MIKIILFRGGFAGDLITALHDMNCFIELKETGQIVIERNRRILQLDFKNLSPTNFKLLKRNTDLSISEKDQYLSEHKIISCHDSEFALKHHRNTLIIKCDNNLMSSFFSKRFYDYHPECFAETTLEDYKQDVLNWNNFWPAKFKNQLDVSDIFENKNFLEKININIDSSKQTLFDNWKEINQKSFDNYIKIKHETN
jgi:hypothetical protein